MSPPTTRLARWYERWILWMIQNVSVDNEEEVWRARLMTVVITVMTVLTGIMVPIEAFLRGWGDVLVFLFLGCTIVSLGGLVLLRVTGRPKLISLGLLGVLMGSQLLMGFTPIGISPALIVWQAINPLVAAFLLGPRIGMLFGALLSVQWMVFEGPRLLQEPWAKPVTIFTLVLGGLFITAMSALVERRRIKAMARLRERERELEQALEEIKAQRSVEARLESRLQRAQRLEALGRLAGGVAHDFNNILTGVLSAAELLSFSEQLTEEDIDDLGVIKQAARRGADLTQQLLTFAKRQPGKPIVINVRNCLLETRTLLQRVLRSTTTLDMDLSHHIPNVRLGQGHLEQILVNLAVNAQDAMEDGGVVRICASRHTLTDQERGLFPELSSGRYLDLRVEDDGHGMDEVTQRQLFEPFFSGKGGTGLGLATVYSIVTQHAGAIAVESAPGEGACFRVLLPVDESLPFYQSPVESSQGGQEHLLLVEDDGEIRRLARRLLERVGYKLTVVHDGTQAVKIADSVLNDVDLLITDVIMPGLNGREVYEALAERSPGLRVLYMSGYTANIIEGHGVVTEGHGFLSKPFTGAKLQSAVRQLLDTNPSQNFTKPTS